MKRKRWWIPIFVLLVLLLLASIPRIYGTELAAVDQMDAYPVLKSAYEDICNQYPLHEISTEDTFYVVTIKNLWGSWQRFILPCYTAWFPDIPSAGSVRCSANLLILAPWSEENIFTNMFRLKMRDFSLYSEPGKNLFISSPYAELTHANLTPVRYLVKPKLINSSEAIICNRLPTVSVEYSLATLDSKREGKQLVVSTLTWDYSLRFMGKKICTVSYDLHMDHFANT